MQWYLETASDHALWGRAHVGKDGAVSRSELERTMKAKLRGVGLVHGHWAIFESTQAGALKSHMKNKHGASCERIWVGKMYAGE
jgi:hypothetical protein